MPSEKRSSKKKSAKAKTFKLWILAALVAAGAMLLCCLGGIVAISLSPGSKLTTNVPPTTPAQLTEYRERVMNSVRGQKFKPLTANVECQLVNHFAVRNLPDYLTVNVTTKNGGGETVILHRTSSLASLLGDGRWHHVIVEIGPATQHTLVDTICLEIFNGREVQKPKR